MVEVKEGQRYLRGARARVRGRCACRGGRSAAASGTGETGAIIAVGNGDLGEKVRMMPRNKPKPLVTDYLTPSLLVISVNEGQLNLGSSWDRCRPFYEGLVKISDLDAADGSMNREMG